MTRFLYLLACVPLAAALLALLRSRYGALVEPVSFPTRTERGLLALALLLGIVIVYGSFYLGTSYFAYRDAGLDTVDLYVPFYLDLLDSLREGSFDAWNFGYGLGSSAVSYQSWLLDPFNLVLIPLGLLLGNERLGLALVIVQSVKILASGLLFDCLAARFCKTPLARMVGSLCFAFCGYLVIWGQHYWLGGIVPLFVLELLVLECLQERRSAPRLTGVVLVTAVCVGWSPYCGFMILVGAAAYMLLRLVHLAEGPHPMSFVLARTGRLLVPVVCGCAIACLTLVPYALYLFGETARVSGPEASLASRAVTYLAGFAPADWLPAIASRLLGSALVTAEDAFPEGLVSAMGSFTGINSYEFAPLGFGPLAIVLLLQFAHWASTEASRRDRVLIAVTAGLFVLYFLNGFLPALLNIFAALTHRSAFILAVPLCLALAVGWERRVQAGRVARIPLVAGAVVSVLVVVWSLVSTVDGIALCLLYLALIVLGVVLLWPLSDARSHRGATLAVCALVVAGVLADAFLVTNNRVVCTEVDFPGAGSAHTKNTEDALAWVSEQDGSLYRVEKTYSDWGLYNDALVEGYRGVNGYNSTGDGDIVTYFRAFWPTCISVNGSSVNFMDAEGALELTGRLGVRYLLSRERQPEPFRLVATFGDVLVYQNDEARGMLFGRAGAIGESEVLGTASPEDRRALLDGRVSVPDDIAAGLPRAEGGETIEARLSLEGEQLVTGSFEAREDSVACLLIPYTEGWTVRVDGQEVETFRADVGFVGFEAPEGGHTIDARYEVPGAAIGLAASACGLVASAILATCDAVTRHRAAA